MLKHLSEVLDVIQTVSFMAAAVLLFVMKVGARGQKVLEAPEELGKKLRSLETRFDEAGKKTSTLASTVQGLVGKADETDRRSRSDHARIGDLNEKVNALPISLATSFLTRRESDIINEDSRTDRARLWRALERMRDGG